MKEVAKGIVTKSTWKSLHAIGLSLGAGILIAMLLVSLLIALFGYFQTADIFRQVAMFIPR